MARFRFGYWTLLTLLFGCLASRAVVAQTRIMPLGDSITHGGDGYASYRYALWFDLLSSSYSIDFVGREADTYGSPSPDPTLYPEYDTKFDRNHEGHVGERTSHILSFVTEATTQAMPDIVLLMLGTNDIGQYGATGVTNADANLRLIVPAIREVNPSAIILLAQIIPIGEGSPYAAVADHVMPLNAAIAAIAADFDTPASPLVLVDQNSGFDLETMVRADGVHPNELGEAQLASVWHAALAEFLTPGNPRPGVSLTAPNAKVTRNAPFDLESAANAWDFGGSVAEVRFMADTTLIGVDTTAPYELTWNDVPIGVHTVTAIAVDDEGASSASESVVVDILPQFHALPLAITNASFEIPATPDGSAIDRLEAPGSWEFIATPNVTLGTYNPTAGSYASAGGSGTPSGADGANVAYLLNLGGPAESLEVRQQLSDVLMPHGEYELRVAIGQFNPNQPFVPSTYGGYRIELIAGTTIIASDEDSFVPPVEEFLDAVASVSADALPAELIGEPLSIRLTITATELFRSSHFDDVRLTYFPPAMAQSMLPAVSSSSAPGITLLCISMLLLALRLLSNEQDLSPKLSSGRGNGTSGGGSGPAQSPRRLFFS